MSQVPGGEAIVASQISDVKAIVKRAADKAGFDLAGIAPAADAPELEHFPEWIASGHSGEMKYLEARDDRGDLKRASLARVAPWARSVIVCAINYNTANPYSTDVHDPDRGWISRYAWSREDYHEAVLRRLKEVEAALRHAVCGEHSVRQAQGNPCSPILTTRSYVDTGPIVERVYAKYAGVGWIGKNTCIINQKKGSWLFLGVILTSLELAPDVPAPDRCGTCTRCIEACPTDAILAPYQLDSNKCISYLTIEKRGSIPEDLRTGMGGHVFGCDICQDVCPWNHRAPASTASEFEPRPGLVNPALAWLAEMSAEEFREVFRGSPIRRSKRSGLRRNAAIAMGNSGNRQFLPLLDQLAADEDESVAECAQWAKARLLTSTL
ncbi:MAG: tRNA epoxyqueuosine(34) reductase QueG [Candidatus Sulfotelmatobacter sp.]